MKRTASATWLGDLKQRKGSPGIDARAAKERGERHRDATGLSGVDGFRPGVFAAGDVRSGSVKRVALAVGEGAMAVQFVHEYLKEM